MIIWVGARLFLFLFFVLWWVEATQRLIHYAVVSLAAIKYVQFVRSGGLDLEVSSSDNGANVTD
jgi:hypothetical protein